MFSLSSSTLDLSLQLTSDTLENFDYIGLGFKVPSDPAGMTGADISVILLDGGASDRYAEKNGVPTLDKDLGGEDDNLNPVFNAETMTYKWSRPLMSKDSQDGLDKEFIEGGDYVVVWASGIVQDGVLKYHRNNRGGVAISLDSNQYGCLEEEEVNYMFIP